MAIGAYATTAAAKLRIYEAGTTVPTGFDTFLDELCNDVNGWIESKTQRVLAPIAAFSSDLNGAVSAGARSVTLDSVTGLNVGDDILIGLLTGLHESVTVVGITTLTVSLAAPLANGYADEAPVQTIIIQDGFSALDAGFTMPYLRGIITLAAVETAAYTRGAWGAIAAGDFYLRPTPPDPGWPFTEVILTNIPSASSTYPVFYPGYANVRLIGPGPCTGQTAVPFQGWPAIPSEITDIALMCVVTKFRARTTAGTDTQTMNVDGSRTYESMLSYTDRQTLDRYRIKQPMVAD